MKTLLLTATLLLCAVSFSFLAGCRAEAAVGDHSNVSAPR